MSSELDVRPGTDRAGRRAGAAAEGRGRGTPASLTRRSSRCTLCPAGCEVQAAGSGPDHWRGEPPNAAGAGLCPRGCCLPELLTDRRRIVSPLRRQDGRLVACDAAAACERIAAAARAGGIVIVLDGNLPVEEMLAAAAWCKAWPAAKLCLAIEPADRELLGGAEAGGAAYLAASELAACDGFLIVGDPFSANPTCSRGIFERRAANPRTPIVAIDPAGGAAAKFASLSVACAPGGEADALAAIAGGTGPAARALADCKKLAVLVAAEFGSTTDLRAVGELAGKVAASRGGGLAVQTVGANALAAVRIEQKLAALSLAAAMGGEVPLVAVGCDVLGMLGWDEGRVLAAAAGLPNATTEAAEVVLPLALSGEVAGTFLLDGAKAVEVGVLLPPPAGVPVPSALVAELARAAGVAAPAQRAATGIALERAEAAPPSAKGAAASARADGPQLLLTRSAMHSGCGSLTGWGSWQAASADLPELRVCPAVAGKLGIENLQVVSVGAGGPAVRARVRVAPETPGGVAVLSDGFPQCRRAVACRLDGGRFVHAAAAAAIASEESRHADAG